MSSTLTHYATPRLQSSFFYLRIRPPPASTLFPYNDALPIYGVEPMTSAVHMPAPMREDVVTEGGDPEDRKSTRLNSSHVRISYAVFCLKKKTNDEGKTLPAAT